MAISKCKLSKISPRPIGTARLLPPFVTQPYTMLEDGIVTVSTIVGLPEVTVIEDLAIGRARRSA